MTRRLMLVACMVAAVFMAPTASAQAWTGRVLNSSQRTGVTPWGGLSS